MAVFKNNNGGKKGSNLNLSNDKLFETIRKRAYELYCKDGYKHGLDQKHWLEAERQVKKEFGLNR